MVGMARFELATSWPPSKRSTKLSYIPTSASVQYTTHRALCQVAPPAPGLFADWLEKVRWQPSPP